MGKQTYRVAIPSDVAGMHNSFHVLMLGKYIPNRDLVVEYESMEIEEGLTYKEMHVQILDHKEQVLCTKKIPIVKELWCNHGVEEASCEIQWAMGYEKPLSTSIRGSYVYD